MKDNSDTSDEDEQVCLLFCFFFFFNKAIYLSILPLDFYMPAVLKYKGIAVVASLIYWMGQLL